MSKQRFRRATEPVRVQALPARPKKDREGNEIQLYNIYGPAYLKH